MRLTHSLTITALASALLLTACGKDSEPLTAPVPSTDNAGHTNNPGIVAGTLEVRAARPTLTLRNTTEFQVGYLVVDKDQAVIALYPPCLSNCQTLRQGESVTINYSAIAGYTARSTEAIVMWWKYVPRADGSLTPEGGIQTVKVRLD